MFSPNMNGTQNQDLDCEHTVSNHDDTAVNFGKDAAIDECFSAHSSEVEDIGLTLNTADNLTLSLPSKQFTKLEVVKAKQIEILLRWHYVAIGAGVLYSLAVIILYNTVFSRVLVTPKEEGWLFDLRIFIPPTGFGWFNDTSSVLVFLAALTLMIVYSTRILSLKFKDITHEQIWVIVLLVSTTFYLLPFQSIITIHDRYLPASVTRGFYWATADWYQGALAVMHVLRISGFSSSTIFYVWASVHSYRFLESKLDARFYLPKIVPLLLYVAGKVLVVYKYRIFPAELVLANLTGMISLYYGANYWYAPGVWFASITAGFDVCFLTCIIYEARKTKQVLKKADYLKYRTKQIGFRFFLYHNITFYAIFIAIYIALQLSVPNGSTVFLFLAGKQKLSAFGIQEAMIGTYIMLLAYSFTEAYVNLPADALGLKGWFKPQAPEGFGAESSEIEPITYRKREPPSLHGVVSDLNVNCFIMQTHVTMFNFAWLVYYWDTPKVDDFKLTQDVFKFTITEYIKDTDTDTHVLVVDGTDRIVIAFKGTTSTKNLKTDINMFYVGLRTLLPTILEECEHEGDLTREQHRLLLTRNWRRSKIHKGFAIAYAAVGPRLLSIIKRLQDEKRRPVFITGHSLGGALATVCSLDLLVTLGLTRREIFVSTFGAPRVGNKPFQILYDQNVPIHWRIVVGPDVVAKLPKIGYIHVGKKVLLTVDGDLFIDPNSLELNLWSGDAASILYHRKASYLLAMRAWCEKHHGDEYLPEFWPFPVSKDDTRRFQHAMTRPMGNTTVSRQTNKRARIMRLDAMIEALDGPATSDRVLELWARLTKRVLEENGKF